MHRSRSFKEPKLVPALMEPCDFDQRYDQYATKRLIQASDGSNKSGQAAITIGQYRDEVATQARAALLKNDIDTAVNLYEQACGSVTRLNRGKYCYETGNCLYMQKHFHSAISYYYDACEYDPSNYNIYLNWGMALWRLGKVGMAAMQFNFSNRLKIVNGNSNNKYNILPPVEDKTVIQQAMKEASDMIGSSANKFHKLGFKNDELNVLKLSIYYWNVDVACQSYERDLFDIDTLLNGICQQECAFVCNQDFPDSASLMTDFKRVTMECYIRTQEYKMGLDLVDYLIMQSKKLKITRKQLSQIYYYKARILTQVYSTTASEAAIEMINQIYLRALEINIDDRLSNSKINEDDLNPSLYHHSALFLVKFKKNLQGSIKCNNLALDIHDAMMDSPILTGRHRDFFLHYSHCLWRYLNSLAT